MSKDNDFTETILTSIFRNQLNTKERLLKIQCASISKQLEDTLKADYEYLLNKVDTLSSKIHDLLQKQQEIDHMSSVSCV